MVAHLKDQFPASHDLGVKQVRALKKHAVQACRSHIKLAGLCAFGPDMELQPLANPHGRSSKRGVPIE